MAAAHGFSMTTRSDPYRFGARQVLNQSRWERWPALRQAWNAPGESKDPEPPAFEGFFEDQKERLLRILSVITGSRAEAEDLAQEAFTRVFERWGSVAGMEDPAATSTAPS
jgi:hypothetical protein